MKHKSAPRKQAGPAWETWQRGQGETILLVEDQKLMQVITTRVLTELGYRVLVAGEVMEGFYLWQAHQQEIRLIITDYTFSGSLTGMDLLMKVQVRMPEIPVLIVSGSWLPDAKKDPPLPPNVVYLAKPFTKAGLAIMVRSLLDSPPAQFQPWSARKKVSP